MYLSNALNCPIMCVRMSSVGPHISKRLREAGSVCPRTSIAQGRGPRYDSRKG